MQRRAAQRSAERSAPDAEQLAQLLVPQLDLVPLRLHKAGHLRTTKEEKRKKSSAALTSYRSGSTKPATCAQKDRNKQKRQVAPLGVD